MFNFKYILTNNKVTNILYNQRASKPPFQKFQNDISTIQVIAWHDFPLWNFMQ